MDGLLPPLEANNDRIAIHHADDGGGQRLGRGRGGRKAHEASHDGKQDGHGETASCHLVHPQGKHCLKGLDPATPLRTRRSLLQSGGSPSRPEGFPIGLIEHQSEHM